MRQRIAARGVIVIALLTWSVTAPAQQQDELRNRPIPGWSFIPGVTIGTLFDSNVGLASEPVGDARNEGDRQFLVQPSAQLVFNGKYTNFDAGYRGYLRRYEDFEALNGYDQRGIVSLRRRATRHVTFYASESYTQSPTTDELELNGVPFSRVGSRQNDVQAGIDAQVGPFTSVSARYDLTSVAFDRDSPGFNGGYVHGVVGTMNHKIAAHVSIGGEYRLRLARLDDGARDITFHDAGGTIHVQTGPHTSIDGAAGVAFVSASQFDASRTGPYFRGAITQELEYATVGGAFERTFVPSFGFGGTTRTQEVRGFIRMPIERRMYVQGTTTWRRSNPLIATELQLDTLRLQSTVGYSLSRWLHLEGFYHFTRQETQLGGLIGRHRAGIQAVIAQPMRLR
ncbi:MAG TPA: hypothetical protein VFK20_04190 [Vicinamibacterales bacterium]|nr:hypothetical protein [Vicinamibacterales bacterium]